MSETRPSEKRPIAVGLGEVLWDLLPAGKQLGGAPANFAFHAQQLGARGVVVSAIGNDALGDEIEQRLEAADLAFAITLDHDHPTGTVSVKLDAVGVPSYVINAPAAWDFIGLADGKEKFQSVADVVCFGSLAQRSAVSRESIHRYLRATRPGCLRIFDINLRQHYFSEPVVRESLELAGVLKLNDQELPVVADLLKLPTIERPFADALFERFPSLRVIALTRGPGGSALFTREATSEHPGVTTTLADTVGAGDAFTATLAMGLLRNVPLDRINAAANRVAAYVCSQHGATPTLPEELKRLLDP